MTAILREQPPELPDTGGVSARACTASCGTASRKIPAERFQSARDLVFNLDAASDATRASADGGRRFPVRESHRCCSRRPRWRWSRLPPGSSIGQRTAAPDARLQVSGIYRLTDFNGLEEFPAIAPDRKSVAFTARVDGFGQIFVRLMAGGTPLQITKDAADHELPRWSRDSSSLIYFSPAAPGDMQGTIWHIPALGGAPRRVIDSVGGGDIGADGRIACFRLAGGQIELVTAAPTGPMCA